jgi:hypothetical protein
MHPAAGEDSAIGVAFLTQARDRLATSHALLKHCAQQLSEDQLWWRPRESQNSVGNLLLHVTGNLRQRIVSVVGGQENARNRDQEFAERGPIAQDVLLARLERVVEECDSVLAGLSPGDLLGPRSYEGINKTFNLDVLSVILHTLLHMAGHTQEIVFMTRLTQGDAYRFSNSPNPAP